MPGVFASGHLAGAGTRALAEVEIEAGPVMRVGWILAVAKDVSDLFDDNSGAGRCWIGTVNLSLGIGVVSQLQIGAVENGKRIAGGVANDDSASGFVILAGRVVVGLIGFDQVGLENDGGQIAFDDLKDERFGLINEVGGFAIQVAGGLKVLGQPTFEVDRFTNVQGEAGGGGEDIDPG